mmetsp:Transcript_21534/g.69647  ORF Transcript_21534/g.69647 Transcript_21534/m.69647 type:complete len:218 (-) Transcript_21534:368-1021(-)
MKELESVTGAARWNALVEKVGIETLEWFLRDRKLDAEEAAAKLERYVAWRDAGNRDVSEEVVADEIATQKARLLPQTDIIGRPTVVVTLERHLVEERVLRHTQLNCVKLMDEALTRLDPAASPPVETVLVLFDLRGFSGANWDLDFVRFFIRIMFEYYPKRISRVLIVGAPIVFRPLWLAVKPLLGKYSTVVSFVSEGEARDYFSSGAKVFIEDIAR